MREFINLINEAISKKTTKKVDRSAFLYLPPKGNEKKFAQCSTCEKFISNKNQCVLFKKKDEVAANGSCGLYIHNQSPQQNYVNSGSTEERVPLDIVTPKQAGYVEGPVRCRNCSWSDGKGKCKLYAQLNNTLPDVFKLDENIEADACCNAWTTKK